VTLIMKILYASFIKSRIRLAPNHRDQIDFTKRVALETSKTLDISYHRVPEVPAEEIPWKRFLQIHSLHEVQAAKSSLNRPMIRKSAEFRSGSRSWVVTVVSVQHPHRVVLKHANNYHHKNRRERVWVCASSSNSKTKENQKFKLRIRRGHPQGVHLERPFCLRDAMTFLYAMQDGDGDEYMAMGTTYFYTLYVYFTF
jgi:hypothetical protein